MLTHFVGWLLVTALFSIFKQETVKQFVIRAVVVIPLCMLLNWALTRIL